MAGKKERKNTIYGIPKKHILFAIVGFLIIIFFCFMFLTNAVNDRIIETNIGTMEEISLHDANSVRNSIKLRWENMEGFARDLSKEKYADIYECLSAMNRRIDNIPAADKVGLLDSDGTYYLSNGVVRKNSSIFEIAGDKEGNFVSRINEDVHFNENSAEVILLGTPMDCMMGDIHVKWLICQFPINTLEKELKIHSYNDEGYSSVIDADGNYIINMSRTHNFLTYDNFYDDLANARLDGIKDVSELRELTTTTTTTEGSTSLTYKLDGVKKIMVITAFDMADWYFVTAVPVSVFEKQTNALVGIFTMLLLVVAIILLAAIFMILRQRKQQIDLQVSEAANKSKTEFLFIMSHDIRTPMNAILGYTDIADKHIDDKERVRECHEKTKIAGRHLLNLINDILEMSRIESGKMDITEAPLDIRDLIESVSLMSDSLALDKSIDFKTEIGEISNPYVLTDELHANEVLINIISNAIKYTPDGGKVLFTSKQVGDVVDGKADFIFEVTDTGIGMSEEYQEHLFEAFTREKSSTVSKQEGTGLGLSIVKKILDLAGGIISVKSKPGEGSTFTIKIPLRVMNDEEIKQYKEAKEPISLDSSAYDFAGKKVLLVEDNMMNREIATEILEDVDLVIDTAEDGELAIKAITEKGTDYYDFVLMDVQMPVMDGYTATKEIRKLPGGENMVIIALSANAFEEDITKSLESGMNAHVSKPIDVEKLMNTVAKFVK